MSSVVKLLDREAVHHRRDLDRPVVGERQQAIGRVPAGIDHLAAAHPLRIGAPGPGALATAQLDAARRRLAKPRFCTASMERNDEWPAQRPGGQQAARLDQARLEELVVRRHEDGAGLLERGPDRDRVLQRRAERFFAEDRLAGPRRGDDGLGVQVVRQADVDRVEIGFSQHRCEIGIGRHLAVAERRWRDAAPAPATRRRRRPPRRAARCSARRGHARGPSSPSRRCRLSALSTRSPSSSHSTLWSADVSLPGHPADVMARAQSRCQSPRLTASQPQEDTNSYY